MIRGSYITIYEPLVWNNEKMEPGRTDNEILSRHMMFHKEILYFISSHMRFGMGTVCANNL